MHVYIYGCMNMSDNSFSYHPGFITVRLFSRLDRANICPALADVGESDLHAISYVPNYCLSTLRLF